MKTYFKFNNILYGNFPFIVIFWRVFDLWFLVGWLGFGQDSKHASHKNVFL